jgi:tight adherence protein C
MTAMQLAFLATIFIAVSAMALFGLYVLTPSPSRRRLRRLSGEATPASENATAWVTSLAKITQPFAKLSITDENWIQSPLRVRFMNAGLRNPAAPAIFFGAKTLLAAFFPAVAYLWLAVSGARVEPYAYMAILLACAALGYYLPNLVLRRLVFMRQRDIFEAFPDAVDLMIVCVEAGLAIDAALIKVASEMQWKSRALSEELHLVTLELRAGASKDKALHNLAARTGVEDIDAFVAMIIQVERFGTSIAASLRVHADTLRTKRRQRAEEAAAKIALKLLFPLMFCIFPTMMLVLLGPAAIRVYRVMLPVMSGTQ